jgi:hypothetical protein
VSTPAPDPGLGRRIYRLGLLPSGEPLRGKTVGDVVLSGAAAACVTCHRRSGFGESEGGSYTPPITGPALFAPYAISRGDLLRPLYEEVQTEPVRARVHDPRVRPAYTAASLAEALKRGVDPSGRILDPLMPRYDVGAADASHLVAYLRTLGAAADPGVDATTIRFATVVTPGADPARRKAMLDVVAAFVRWKNAATQGLQAHPGSSPGFLDELARGYRQWAIDVWELTGPPAGWEEQLRARARERPVFALVGGVGGVGGVGEPWWPIHRFCEEAQIPCLFPATELPVTSPLGDYSFYLSSGPEGEAECLASYLRDGPDARAPVVQVYRASRTGDRRGGVGEGPAEWVQIAAGVLRRELGETVEVKDFRLPAEGALPSSLWNDLVAISQVGPVAGGETAPGPAPVVVLWLSSPDLRTLDLAAAPVGRLRRLVLSYRLAGEPPRELPDAVRERLRLLYPYALPQQLPPRTYRVRAWLRARGVPPGDERLQLDTYFALTVADHALAHLVERFDRDYFDEQVEHEVENALNPGVYPHLSLGPGQRFASKGCYVVRATAGGGIEAESGWIVP